IVQVRGEVVANRPDRLLMSAFALESVSQYEHLAAGETVLIPRDALGQIEEKRISATRTALAGAVLAGAGYLIQLGLRTAIGGGDGGEPPPPSK
ncbi:MAG: hypothetical protein GWM90_10315, partial [Gemmatimonadetes bacterium]|nr:hypothetical protein [Gemmatimonadota bacterium]NIQ54351.1 hypothetical protein [Gemmatimonadota bacterium]NIU74561.1 hypothetical protein [Gammaproteobacteria bacterium]NIX44496.1 hypothetical protein [Gemmatimonadota bacterium]NIY08726.1 hypothetical protein [Gemmatimonadota bacterium]